jgi:hypothetical protein
MKYKKNYTPSCIKNQMNKAELSPEIPEPTTAIFI